MAVTAGVSPFLHYHPHGFAALFVLLFHPLRAYLGVPLAFPPRHCVRAPSLLLRQEAQDDFRNWRGSRFHDGIQRGRTHGCALGGRGRDGSQVGRILYLTPQRTTFEERYTGYLLTAAPIAGYISLTCNQRTRWRLQLTVCVRRM